MVIWFTFTFLLKMVIHVSKSRSQERELSDFQGQESLAAKVVSVFPQEFSEIFSPFLYHIQTSRLNGGSPSRVIGAAWGKVCLNLWPWPARILGVAEA